MKLPKTLPKNAVAAFWCKRVHSIHGPLGGPDIGVFRERNRVPIRLMTWGLNFSRRQVEYYSGRQFVFVGTRLDTDGTQRENYEEVR